MMENGRVPTLVVVPVADPRPAGHLAEPSLFEDPARNPASVDVGASLSRGSHSTRPPITASGVTSSAASDTFRLRIFQRIGAVEAAAVSAELDAATQAQSTALGS
jgi:hypothetical protein